MVPVQQQLCGLLTTEVQGTCLGGRMHATHALRPRVGYAFGCCPALRTGPLWRIRQAHQGAACALHPGKWISADQHSISGSVDQCQPTLRHRCLF